MTSKIQYIFFIIFTLFVSICFGQKKISYGERIQTLTTKIEVYKDDKQINASGFYYQHIDTSTTENISRLFLTSNRHVLYLNESFPDSIIFNLIEYDFDTNNYLFLPITINKEYLIENISLHENSGVDVAVIQIDSIAAIYMKEYNIDRGSRGIIPVTPIRNINVSYHISQINPEVGDDVMIIGFPEGFYDAVNKIPLVKSGMIASFYGRDYNGEPKFLIDAKLFSGFSGGIVVAKPKASLIVDEKPVFFHEKYVIFLGIYSGEPFVYGNTVDQEDATYREKRKMDLGNVWYPKVLDEIIE